jgi:hypothetical protein
VVTLTPNVIAVRHWNRLLEGALYAATPRLDWSTLLRRSFGVDVLRCPKCDGKLRMIELVTEREPARQILERLGIRSERPSIARARDPTDDVCATELSRQPDFELA